MVWMVLNAEQDAAINELVQTQQSDRIVAILGGALLDNSIRKALELRLRAKDGNTDMKDRFRVSAIYARQTAQKLNAWFS